MKVKYTGPADAYELGAADFTKGGVEGARKTRFPKNEPVEVSDEIGDLLLNSEEGPFAGSSDIFEKVEDDEEPEDDGEPKSQAADADSSEMTDSGRASSSGATGSTGASGSSGTTRGGRNRGTTTST